MRSSSRPGPLTRAAILLGGLGAFLMVQQAPAGPLVEYTGYTRPASNPLDKSKKIDKEKIEAVAAEDEAGKRRPKSIAGTVYFMVLNRSKGTKSDPWGTGIKDFEKVFHVSPDSRAKRDGKLDIDAKYFYLYQVVNDSGDDGWVHQASIRLLIDPRLVTSWGHFSERQKTGTKGLGFAMQFEKGKGVKAASAVLPVAAEEERQGVASREYRPRDRAHRAPKVYGLSGLDLYRHKDKIVPIAATEIAREPDKVLLVNSAVFDDGKGGDTLLPRYRLPEVVSEGDRQLAPTGNSRSWAWAMDAKIRSVRETVVEDAPATNDRLRILWPVIRAYWHEEPLRPGDRSTIFGFTSDYPPVYDFSQIKDRPLAQLSAIRPVAGGDEGVASAGGIAPAATGGVPTPITPAAAPTPAAGGGGGAVGGIGGLSGPGGGGAPAGFASGAGFMAPRGLSGGGGIGGGTGSGTPSSTTPPNQNQNQTPSITNNNTANAIQSQRQQQFQLQQQQQQQQQQQRQQQSNCCNHGHMVPAPPAWLLGLLGLPVFAFMARRRKAGSSAEGTPAV